MTLSGCACGPRRAAAARRGRRHTHTHTPAARVAITGALVGAIAIACADCSLSSSAGTYIVDPGRYSVLHCKDLVAQWTTLSAREQELRKLQDKASEGTGGAFIGAISYRADYEAVLADKKLVQQEANGKNCSLVPNYQSDQTIR